MIRQPGSSTPLTELAGKRTRAPCEGLPTGNWGLRFRCSGITRYTILTGERQPEAVRFNDLERPRPPLQQPPFPHLSLFCRGQKTPVKGALFWRGEAYP